MGTLGPNNGNTFVSDGTLGSITMANPSNAQFIDGVYANAALLLGQISNYLKVTNFGFAIPLDATVTGVTVQVRRNATSLSAVSDSSVKLVVGGVIVGNDKASATTWTTSDVTVSYGSSADMWGLSLAPSDINSSGFGLVINAIASSVATVNIDWVGIIIDYVGSNKAATIARGFKTGNGLSVSEGVN